MDLDNTIKGAAFDNGHTILNNKGICIVGLSPNNSYFKAEVIDALLAFCAEKFLQTYIMVPDKPMEHTYKAMGYSEQKAKKKARLNGNTLQNHSHKSIQAISGNVKLIEWQDDIESKPCYQQEFIYLQNMYKVNAEFRNEVRETTRAVLQGKIKDGLSMEAAIDEGIFYLLKELTFLSISPQLYNSPAAYVYHQRWPVFEHFIEGAFDNKKREDLGFVIVR